MVAHSLTRAISSLQLCIFHSFNYYSSSQTIARFRSHSLKVSSIPFYLKSIVMSPFLKSYILFYDTLHYLKNEVFTFHHSFIIIEPHDSYSIDIHEDYSEQSVKPTIIIYISIFSLDFSFHITQ